MPRRTDASKVEGNPLFTVEDLAQRHKLPDWALRGMLVRYNWGHGKELTEAEFFTARDAFLNSPMKGGVK